MNHVSIQSTVIGTAHRLDFCYAEVRGGSRIFDTLVECQRRLPCKGGPEACFPEKILKFGTPEMQFPGFWGQIFWSKLNFQMLINF